MTAIIASDLGEAHRELPGLRDLSKADEWFRRSLELRSERDRLGLLQCDAALGLVAYERFLEARDAGRPEVELLQYLNAAATAYHIALDLSPPDAPENLAVMHNQLGNVYNDAGDLKRGLHHFREAIRHYEEGGDLFRAAQSRRNAAAALWVAHKRKHPLAASKHALRDALKYAQAALDYFTTFGDRMRDELQTTYQIIALIEGDMRRGGRGGGA